ncbi:hypothetical protein [Tessaracoccus sp.]
MSVNQVEPPAEFLDGNENVDWSGLDEFRAHPLVEPLEPARSILEDDDVPLFVGRTSILAEEMARIAGWTPDLAAFPAERLAVSSKLDWSGLDEFRAHPLVEPLEPARSILEDDDVPLFVGRTSILAEEMARIAGWTPDLAAYPALSR